MVENAPNLSGGEQSTRVGSLDMASERDRALVRDQIKEHAACIAGLDADFTARMVRALGAAEAECGAIVDTQKRVAARASIVRTFALLVGINERRALTYLKAELETAAARERMEREAMLETQRIERQRVEVAVTVSGSEGERLSAAVRVLTGLGLQLPADLVPGPATNDRHLER